MRTLSDVPEVTVKVAKLGFGPRNLGGTLHVLNWCPEFCHGQQCVEPQAPVQGLPPPPQNNTGQRRGQYLMVMCSAIRRLASSCMLGTE